MSEQAPSPARAALGMGVVTAISRGFGFVRVLVIAGVLGATYLGNTFQATNSMSNVRSEFGGTPCPVCGSMRPCSP